MAKFDYTAFDAAGKQITGVIEAETSAAALRLLNQQGHFPIDVTEQGGSVPSGGRSSFDWFSRRPSESELTLFAQELALLLTAGQPLSRALSLIEADSNTPRVQAMVRRLRAQIAEGRSLNEAMAHEGGLFPPVFVGMVKAAEASGTLKTVLARIAETREREQRLRSKLVSALLYPAILILMALGAVVLMIGVVVPQFKSMLGEQSHRLPAASQAVIAASDWLTANGEMLALGIIGALVVLLVALRRPAVQAVVERMAFATPLLGSLLRLSLTSRFCRTLGILLESNLGLPAALALTRDVIGNQGARQVIDEIRVALRQGGDFTEPLKTSTVFPPMVTSLLRIGAESGTLPASALRLADMYESKLEIAMQRLVGILEPVIILTVSVFIGFIVLTIMNAIIGVYDLTGL